jgi:hypothetical protein
MTPTTSNGRRRVLASVGASVLATLVLAGTAGSVAAESPTVTGAVVDGTLQITGSQVRDTIVLRLAALDPTQLQVDVGDDGSADLAFALATFAAIDVAAVNGDDTVRIDQGNGTFTTTKPTHLDGGQGNDTLSGGSGAERFVGGNGDDVVDGNAGADTGFLGNGDDVFVWDQGDGSDVVEGERGSDTMVFNGFAANEIMAASAAGERVRFTRVQGNIVMDLNDVEGIDVRPQAGSDSVTVNDTSGTDLERVDVDLAANLAGASADATADVVTVTGTSGNDSISAAANGAAVEVGGAPAVVRVTNADPDRDNLVIDPGAGTDQVAIDPALAALILVTVL